MTSPATERPKPPGDRPKSRCFGILARIKRGERLANARALKRANGLRTSGRVPLGYSTEPRTKQLIVIEPEATVVRWFFLETANGTTTGRLVTLANQRRFATKTGKTGAWSGREALRLLRNEAKLGSAVIPIFHVSSREDVDRVMRAWSPPGHRSHKAPEDELWGARYAIVEDPDGNSVGIMSAIADAMRRAPPAPPRV